MPALTTRTPAPTIISDDVDLPPKFPDLPGDLLQRFPSLEGWEEDTTSWYRRVYDAIQGNNRTVSQTVGAVAKIPGDLIVKVDGAIAAIQTETTARINADEILARRIVTVSAISGTASNIVIQNTAPVSPTANEIWINNSDLLNPITYQWDGVQWNEVTEPITVAAVAAEQTARITADGFLSGKYSLTVIAGNVVTGMNITSSSGPGTNISSVIFRATDFQIYNGTTGITMFQVSGSDVTLAGTLVTSTAGKVFIGAGAYNDPATQFYVDSSGFFSLGDQLTWDGSTLSIASGPTVTVDWNTQVTGRPAYLTDGRIPTAISSAGLVVSGVTPGINVTTGGAGLYLGADFMGYYNGAAWRTYMDNTGNFYLGGVSGALQWNGTTLAITGTITATAGTIGGWTLSSTTLSRNNATLDSAGQLVLGTGSNVVVLSATDATYRVWVGNATAGSANFAVSKTGAMFSSGATIVGSVTFASTNRVLATDNASFLTWQGPAGANTAGFYTQQSAAGGGFSAYGVGGGSPLIGLYRSNGTYGSPTNLPSNTVVGTLFVEGFVGGAYNETGRLQWGISANGNTPYFKVEVTDASSANIQNWIFNYDGKMYFTAPNDVFSPNSGIYSAPYVADPLANLYRSSAGTMKTDGGFVVTGNLQVAGSFAVAGSFTPSNISTGSISGTTITASTGFSGPGGSINSLNASNISSGTLDNARLPSAISVASVTTTGAVNCGGTLTVTGGGIFNSGWFSFGSCTIFGGLGATGPLSAGNGSAGAPGLHFAGSSADGWFWNSSGDIRAATSGTTRFVVRDAAIVLLVPLKLDNSFVPGAPTPTGYVTIQDAGGVTRQIPCS